MTDPANFSVWWFSFCTNTHTERERESRNIPKWCLSFVCGKATEMSGIFTLEEVTKKTGVHGTSQWANSRVAQEHNQTDRAHQRLLYKPQKRKINKKRKSRYFFHLFFVKKRTKINLKKIVLIINWKTKILRSGIIFWMHENRSCFRMCDVTLEGGRDVYFKQEHHPSLVGQTGSCSSRHNSSFTIPHSFGKLWRDKRVYYFLFEQNISQMGRDGTGGKCSSCRGG